MSQTTVNRYMFDNSTPESVTQMDSLEAYLDPITFGRLDETDLGAGAVCWEIGAGGGSVARAMADRVGPTGTVVATDLDTGRIRDTTGLQVRVHDVRSEPAPAEGPFDLIHARLVLMHLPEREQVLTALTAALKPGGWLLVEDFDCTDPTPVLTSPGPEESALFRRVIDGTMTILRNQGASEDWANHIHSRMAGLGLTDLATVEHATSWSGGGYGCRLHASNSGQLQGRLVELGLTVPELERFRALMTDPNFSALGYQIVSTLGRKPV